MNTQNRNTDHLIARYLAGEALPDEAIALDEWRAESPENELYFADAYAIFHGAGQSAPVFDPQKAWDKLRFTSEPESDVSSASSPVREPKPIQLQPKRTWTWKLAAGIALIAALAAAISYFIRTDTEVQSFASENNITTDTLPTGSLISLNAQSNLEYRYEERNQSESMALSGEAYFDLRAPEGTTTTVEAEGLTIRDIGTAFHVSAYPYHDTVVVWVEQGKVAIYTAENPGITLSPGEGGLFVKSTGHIARHTPALLPNWHQTAKAFHFYKAQLPEVAKAFNDQFELKLKIPNHLHDCRITVSFADETPLSMATIIAETLGLDLEQKGDTLHLSGNGCPQ